MKLVFRCNLDEVQRDVDELNREAQARFTRTPAKGERIRFSFDCAPEKTRRCYDLEVCEVTFDLHLNVCEIELHMPSYYVGMSISDWSKQFKRHRGL